MVASSLSLPGTRSAGVWAEETKTPTPSPTQKEPAAPPSVQDNMSVQLEYTLKTDGHVVDSTTGRGPFRYVHGRGQIVPGLERQLAGLHVGESKEITVGPDEAYGPVDPSALIEVPKAQLPPDVKPEVGLVLRGVDPNGRTFRATIHEVKDQAVTLDLNHPLAGKTLNFSVKVTEISPAQ